MSYWCKNIRIVFLSLLFISGLSSQAQDKEVRIVNFSADLMDYDESLGSEVHRLLGHVWMKHDDLILTCDSAHLNQQTNEFKGYGSVHIIKADTLNLFGDYLDYNGTSRMAQLNGR
ncbi:MAG: hypothetical protein J7L96_01905, partial [Bacteroidales bacterium]|nr:hypothetical protein [Bacteroidales bacterium]